VAGRLPRPFRVCRDGGLPFSPLRSTFIWKPLADAGGPLSKSYGGRGPVVQTRTCKPFGLHQSGLNPPISAVHDSPEALSMVASRRKSGSLIVGPIQQVLKVICVPGLCDEYWSTAIDLPRWGPPLFSPGHDTYTRPNNPGPSLLLDSAVPFLFDRRPPHARPRRLAAFFPRALPKVWARCRGCLFPPSTQTSGQRYCAVIVEIFRRPGRLSCLMFLRFGNATLR